MINFPLNPVISAPDLAEGIKLGDAFFYLAVTQSREFELYIVGPVMRRVEYEFQTRNEALFYAQYLKASGADYLSGL